MARYREGKMKSPWRGKLSVEESAAVALPELALAYFAAGSALGEGAQKPEELHKFRLKTKHFRYTLELFEETYGPAFGTLLKRLKPVQDALGEINDAATALAWLGRDDSTEVKAFLTTRIADQSARFEKHWKEIFDKPGARKHWVTVLGKAAASGSGDGKGSRDRRLSRAPAPRV